MRIVWRGLLAGAMLGVCAVAGYADTPDGDLRRRFEAEAPAAWDAYQAANRFVQGVCRGEGTGSDHPPIRSETEWKCNESCRLARQSNPETGVSEVFCQNAKYSFRLKREKDRPWVLVALHQGDNLKGNHAQDLGRRLDDYSRLMTAPVVRLEADGQMLADLVRSGRAKVTSFRSKQEGGRSLVEVRFDASPDPAEKRPLVGGELVLDPDRNWLPISHTARVRNRNGTGAHTVEFEYGPDAHPPQRKVRTRIEYVLNNQKEPWRSGGAADYEFQVPKRLPPDTDFTLSAFGLPEPVGVTWDRPTPRYVWFLAAAGGFGLLAVVLRAIARWKRAPAAGTA